MRPDTVVNERRNTSAEISCCNVKAPRTRLLLGLLAIGMIAGGPAVPLGSKALQVVNNSAFDGTASTTSGRGTMLAVGVGSNNSAVVLEN
jgi:hypothetical protein